MERLTWYEMLYPHVMSLARSDIIGGIDRMARYYEVEREKATGDHDLSEAPFRSVWRRISKIRSVSEATLGMGGARLMLIVSSMV